MGFIPIVITEDKNCTGPSYGWKLFKSFQSKQQKGLSQQQTMQVKTAVPVGQPKNGSQAKCPITLGDESDIDVEVLEVPELSTKQLQQ